MTQDNGHERDEVSTLEWIMMEIDRIVLSERERVQIRQMLQAQAGQVVRFTHKVLLRPERVAHARRLLDLGSAVATVRDALMTRYGCSTSHAYQLIREALTERGRERTQQMQRAQGRLL